MVVMAETVAVSMVVIVGVAMVMIMVVRMCMRVLMVVMVIHASIPLAGSAMCSNMVASRLLMWASTAA